VLYGFGELVDKACDIELNTRGAEKRNAAPLNSYSERISKLDTLRSQGLITEEEYQAKRREIISNL
jgi:cytochrome c-type biogenesis protein CcmH/NrfG